MVGDPGNDTFDFEEEGERVVPLAAETEELVVDLRIRSSVPSTTTTHESGKLNRAAFDVLDDENLGSRLRVGVEVEERRVGVARTEVEFGAELSKVEERLGVESHAVDAIGLREECFSSSFKKDQRKKRTARPGGTFATMSRSLEMRKKLLLPFLCLRQG